MSLTIVAGPLALLSSTPMSTDTFGDMQRCAAKVLHGESQSAVRSKAADGIRRGIDDLNMRHVFNFGSNTESDATIVDATADYAIPADTFAVRAVQLIDSDSKVYADLLYEPWDGLRSYEGSQNRTGLPELWTIRNLHDDLQVTLYPVPTASVAANYTLRISTYERIAQLTSESDTLVAPRELSDVLCTYAEYHLYNWAGEQSKARDKLAIYHDKLKAFKWSVRRMTDLPRQRKMGLNRRSPRGFPTSF